MLRHIHFSVAVGVVIGLAVAEGAETQSSRQKIHSVILLEDRDPEIGATVKYDAQVIFSLFKKATPAESVGEPVGLLESQDELDMGRIVAAIQKLDVGPADTIFCFYSGRGGFTKGGESYLELPDGNRLLCNTLTSLLKGRGAKRTVLLTDWITPDADLPLTGEKLLLNDKSAFSRLLLSDSGVVEINSFGVDQRGYHHQQRTDEGANSRGSLFVRELVKECTVGKTARNPSPTWNTLGEELRRNINDSLSVAAKSAGSQAPRVDLGNKNGDTSAPSLARTIWTPLQGNDVYAPSAEQWAVYCFQPGGLMYCYVRGVTVDEKEVFTFAWKYRWKQNGDEFELSQIGSDLHKRGKFVSDDNVEISSNEGSKVRPFGRLEVDLDTIQRKLGDVKWQN